MYASSICPTWNTEEDDMSSSKKYAKRFWIPVTYVELAKLKKLQLISW